MAPNTTSSKLRLLLVTLLASCGIWFSPLAVQASSSWWEPTSLTQPVTAVAASHGMLVVRTGDGRLLQSTDGGAHFSPATAAAPSLQTRPPAVSGDAPAGIRLLATPASLPGTAVAVTNDNTVWRRGANGSWARSLIPLPTTLFGSAPTITGAATFDKPVSYAVYISTDGYSVMLSLNGGDDWVRAGQGLPDDVSGLAADSQHRAVFAATAQGLFVHHLQAFPAPPTYKGVQLWLWWIGIVGVALVATAAAAFVISRQQTRPGASV